MMMLHSFCVVLLCVGTVSAVFSSEDADLTFIIFDVSTHKGSTGSIKSAFNRLTKPEYAVKILGEDRAFFVVRNDDECDTIQSDFNGLNVDAQPARARDVDIKFNETGLVVMVIDTSLDDESITQAIADALLSCEDCFKAFAVFGNKPKRLILIGNIPLELTGIIANTTTSDSCCDKVYTKRAVDFNTFNKKHISGCIDIHAPQKQSHQPFIHPKPVHPVHPAPAFPDKFEASKSHQPFLHPKPVHPVHPAHPASAFPDQFEASKVDGIPVDPHKVNFPGLNPHNPNFRNINFPGITKGGRGYRPSGFPGYSKGGSGYRSDNFAPHFNFDTHGESGQRTYV